MSSYFDKRLGKLRDGEGGSGGGGGGGTPEVVSSGGSVAIIPVLSGGKCYRFTDELVTLSIGSIADTPAEDTIIFSAGGIATPPGSMTVAFQTMYFDEENWSVESGSKTLTLASSGGRYVATIDEMQWSYADHDEDYAGAMLSGGSFVGIVSGGNITVSAYNVGVLFSSGNYNDGESSGSSALNGLVASSADGGSSWTFGGVTIPCYYFEYIMEVLDQYSGSACAVGYDPTVTPCAVLIPSGAVLIGSSKIELESGHSYEMNVANGGIVMGERCAQEVSS